MSDWRPAGIIPVDAADETIEALARIYVGRIASVDEADVLLGEYERAAILVAKAEVACVQEMGVTPQLWFSGPPLSIEVIELDSLQRPPPPDVPLDG